MSSYRVVSDTRNLLSALCAGFMVIGWAGAPPVVAKASTSARDSRQAASRRVTPNQQVVPSVAREEAESIRELRIGVVCYGGVSLAIYMHGITKELQNLVWASRWLEAGRPIEELRALVKDGSVDASVVPYFHALASRREREGVTTRVVIDSISGTSAGGINAVFLAKGLSRGVSQNDLRDLWFSKADKWKLLGGRFRGVLNILGLVVRAPFGQARPPFRGNSMYEWLLEALDQMDENLVEDPDGAQPTLVPEGDPLRLFITTTDYSGYARTLRIGDPAFGVEKDFQKTLSFTKAGRRDQFSPEWNALLAFAARSTSSFPGAFEPVSPADLLNRLRERGRPDVNEIERKLREELFSEYLEDGADPLRTTFIDGGVLDNGPFTPVIEDITRRPPRREVGERLLLYLEPDPAPPASNPDGKRRPRFYGPILRSLSSIPRFQPMAPDLRRVEQHNRRALLLRDLIVASREELAVALPFRRQPFSQAATLHKERESAREERRPNAGYLRLRMYSVLEQMWKGLWRLHGMTEDGTYAIGTWALLEEWATRKGWIGSGEASPEVLEVLEDLDVGFQIRRLQFASDEIQLLYQSEMFERKQLDRASRTLADHVQRLAPLMQVDSLPHELTESIATLLDPTQIREAVLAASSPGEFARRFVDRHQEALDSIVDSLRDHVKAELMAERRDLRDAFSVETEDWPQTGVERLVVAYFGFSGWDELLYPYHRIGGGGELREIRIVRVSPSDSSALAGGGASEKLGGVKLFHFGAFFSRRARERDYLWGRLDGLERILGVVGGADAVPRSDLQAGFEAVLQEVDSQSDQLRFASELAEEIREKMNKDLAWRSAPEP